MKAAFRVHTEMLAAIRADLRRPHRYAAERVGFVFCRFATLANGDLLTLAFEYMSVADDEYIEDSSYGALIGAGAFRKALQRTLPDALGIFHTHLHAHAGAPGPSRTDLRESAKFVPDFFHVRGDLPHGTLIASDDRISGRIWFGERDEPAAFATCSVVGIPYRTWRLGT